MVAVSLDGSRDVNDSMRIDNDRLGTLKSNFINK